MQPTFSLKTFLVGLPGIGPLYAHYGVNEDLSRKEEAIEASLQNNPQNLIEMQQQVRLLEEFQALQAERITYSLVAAASSLLSIITAVALTALELISIQTATPIMLFFGCLTVINLSEYLNTISDVDEREGALSRLKRELTAIGVQQELLQHNPRT